MGDVADLPSQAGRVAVVTGASAGIGLATAEALAESGCHVVLAVRDSVRGADAAGRSGSIMDKDTRLFLDLAKSAGEGPGEVGRLAREFVAELGVLLEKRRT